MSIRFDQVAVDQIAYIEDKEGCYNAVTPANGMKFEIKYFLKFLIYLQYTAPAVLTWQNLSVTTKARRNIPPKAIINSIDGSISGGLWGIMGASGSGKTTLLSVLSLRLDTMRMTVSGDIRLSNEKNNI